MSGKANVESEGNERRRMSLDEAKNVLSEEMYMGMMDILVVEVSKRRIAERLTQYGGQPLPRRVYDNADMMVEAFFTLLEDEAENECRDV